MNEFKVTPLSEAQRELVGANLSLVDAAASALWARLRTFFTRDELVAAGYVGLVEAARNFDPALGVPFAGFASFRIRGAMFDEAKKQASQSRALMLAAQAAACEAAAMIPPPGAVLGSSEQDSLARLRALTDGVAASMFAVLAGAPRPPSAEEQLDRSEQHQRCSEALASAVRALPEGFRALIEGHYFVGRDLKDVAVDLRVSYATVRRHHFAALEQLGRRLRAAGVHDHHELHELELDEAST